MRMRLPAFGVLGRISTLGASFRSFMRDAAVDRVVHATDKRKHIRISSHGILYISDGMEYIIPYAEFIAYGNRNIAVETPKRVPKIQALKE